MGLEEMLNRYVITSAEYGAKVNHKQLDAYERYAEEWDARILVIPIEGQYKDEPMHERISQYEVVDSMKLNNNLEISNFGVKAQTINPLTGLRRFGKSTIIGSPKQHLELVANSPQNSPHAIMSTGVCTLPNYKDNRIGSIGDRDHKQGAILVEIEDDELFHYRQSVNTSDGSFVDLGIKYVPDGRPYRVDVDTVVLGDLHDAQKDLALYEATKTFLTDVKPKIQVWHDVMDSYSISHHDLSRNVRLGKKAALGQLDLQTELYNLGRTVEELSQYSDKCYVVKSNHDEHLTRWLDEGRFMNEPHNLGIGLQLAYALFQGKDPVEEGIKLAYGKVPKNVKFLQRDDELKRQGVELGFHGDIGPRGARGSPISHEYSLRNAVLAHMHVPYIRKDIMGVGAMMLNPDYAKGSANNTMCTHAIINHNKTKQLVNIVDGRYTI